MYKVSGRVSASVAPAGFIRLEWDGELGHEIEVGNTTNTRAFELQEWEYRYLEKGTHTFMIHITAPSFHQLDYIQFDLQK